MNSEKGANPSLSISVESADATRNIGKILSGYLKAGDLVMLRGDLGAGKTTFTQGIGDGLQIQGHVSSPTFIVARAHSSLVGGPHLIHADAYRISDLKDLETLDLDSSLDGAVTVVEWGEGKTESLSDSRLEIEFSIPSDQGHSEPSAEKEGGSGGGPIGEKLAGRQQDIVGSQPTARDDSSFIDLTSIDDGIRTLSFYPHGQRWVDEFNEFIREMHEYTHPGGLIVNETEEEL